MLAGTSVAYGHHVDHRSEVTEVIILQIARDITVLKYIERSVLGSGSNDTVPLVAWCSAHVGPTTKLPTRTCSQPATRTLGRRKNYGWCTKL